MKIRFFSALAAMAIWLAACTGQKKASQSQPETSRPQVLDIIHQVNGYWSKVLSEIQFIGHGI